MTPPGDLLLGWVSCHREIRIDRVRRAAARLCAAPVEHEKDDGRRSRYRLLADRIAWSLPRLAHVEPHGRDRFRVVPPSIVSTGRGRHFLTGARCEVLIKSLRNSSGMEIHRDIQDDAPAVLWFETDEETARAAAESSGFTHVRERGRELLASLPALDGLLRDAPRDVPPDACERWERAGKWEPVRSGSLKPGLYRSVRRPRAWYLAPEDSAETLRLNTPERRSAAAWALTPERRLFRGQDGSLLVPRMPFGLASLVERALILASGCLPETGPRGRTYHDIDPERARQLARIVGARLEAPK